MNTKPPLEHCDTCEMKSSCQRDGRCWVPKTLGYWMKEAREAAEAMAAANERLRIATEGLRVATAREFGQ